MMWAQSRELVEKTCTVLEKPVDVIVNYDGFQLDDDVNSDYAEIVQNLEARFYGNVTRYSGSAFLRLKLGETLKGMHCTFSRRKTARNRS